MSVRYAYSCEGAQTARRPRGWRRLWQVPTFVVGCLVLAVTAATAPLRGDPSRPFQGELRQLRRALREPARLAEVESSIARLSESAEAFPRHQAEFHFLAGSYCYLRAEQEPEPTEWRVKANEHLTLALTLGVAEDDLPTLQLRLGMTQYRQGQHLTQALAWIRQGLDLGADESTAGYAFLVKAYLDGPEPNLTAALAVSQKHLASVDDRNVEALGQARHQHAAILARLERRSEALQELEQVETTISKPLLARVRHLQATCAEEEGLWAQALNYWRDLEPLANEVPGGAGRVQYALGLAWMRRGLGDAATAERHWHLAISCGGEEGQAAALRLGHLVLADERCDAPQALERWTKALAGVRAPGDYRNRYVDRAAAIELIDAGVARVAGKRQFERAVALVELLGRLAAPGAAEAKRGRIHQQWGHELLAKAETGERDKHLHEAWSRFQNAGDDFSQASLSRDTAGKIELYWQSADCYLAGQDFVKAALALEKFVALTTSDARLAQGHFSLAETYQAQGQKAKAREHFLKCIELNTPPFDNRARFRLARQEMDSKNLTAARDILAQLVQHVGPDLQRDLHEQASYLYANLLFDLGELDEAALRLREAARRFPDHADALAARDRLGEYYWEKKAKAIATEMNEGGERRPLAEAMRLKRREYLEEALKVYQELDRDLARFPKKKFTSAELHVWRKALFSAGRLRLELEDYAGALEHFRGMQASYRGHVESLFAARNIYECWRELTRGDENHPLHATVLEVIQSALRDLDSIPRDREEELFGTSPGNASREDWRQFLRRWEGEIRHVTLRVSPGAFAPGE